MDLNIWEYRQTNLSNQWNAEDNWEYETSIEIDECLINSEINWTSLVLLFQDQFLHYLFIIVFIFRKITDFPLLMLSLFFRDHSLQLQYVLIIIFLALFLLLHFFVLYIYDLFELCWVRDFLVAPGSYDLSLFHNYNLLCVFQVVDCMSRHYHGPSL